MEFEMGFTDKKEFESDRICDICNSQEGKMRMVGNIIVELSEVNVDENIQLACQFCKNKQRNLNRINTQNRKSSILKKLTKRLFN